MACTGCGRSAPLWLHQAHSKLRVPAKLEQPCLPSATIMIIYRDLIAAMVSRTEGNTGDSLIGGNASAEGLEGEGTESTVDTGVDIVMNHHLQETNFTKEAYKEYIKDYMKSIKGKLEEQRPERVKPFMTGAAEQIKHILANFKSFEAL
ncbi:Translationally-controlled tumor protein [Heterocephalus glaber]|uniref:Translationally-controlled tumor protein n=1 Tax=Heterocephalus glaber TaxID=10181 RepID=G5AS36_HETGA|nr:Translationally-controlled tumor protein [Heterocephalus glaber]